MFKATISDCVKKLRLQHEIIKAGSVHSDVVSPVMCVYNGQQRKAWREGKEPGNDHRERERERISERVGP
jgi:hypothetical protein